MRAWSCGSLSRCHARVRGHRGMQSFADFHPCHWRSAHKGGYRPQRSVSTRRWNREQSLQLCCGPCVRDVARCGCMPSRERCRPSSARRIACAEASTSWQQGLDGFSRCGVTQGIRPREWGGGGGVGEEGRGHRRPRNVYQQCSLLQFTGAAVLDYLRIMIVHRRCIMAGSTVWQSQVLVCHSAGLRCGPCMAEFSVLGCCSSSGDVSSMRRRCGVNPLSLPCMRQASVMQVEAAAAR